MTTMPKFATDAIAKLEAVVKDYVETGVAIIEADYTDTSAVGILAPQPIKTFLRRLSKDMKRPFIVAIATHWHPWERDAQGVYSRQSDKKAWCGRLRLPLRKRFDPIIAALLLVSEEGDRYHYNSTTPPVRHYRGKTFVEFNFNGDDGFALFNSFLNQCRTDPVFKIVLRAA